MKFASVLESTSLRDPGYSRAVLIPNCYPSSYCSEYEQMPTGLSNPRFVLAFLVLEGITYRVEDTNRKRAKYFCCLDSMLHMLSQLRSKDAQVLCQVYLVGISLSSHIFFSIYTCFSDIFFRRGYSMRLRFCTVSMCKSYFLCFVTSIFILC